MNNKSILWTVLVGFALVLGTLGCATSKPTKAQQTTSLLASSGFKIVPATTPDQQQQMKTLPAGKVSVVKRNGKTYYVYPDHGQNVLYVGNQAQYEGYKNAVIDQKLTAEDAKAMADSRGEALMNEQVNAANGGDTPGWGAVWGDGWDIQQ